MKPFDLEAFKAGKPAVTREGEQARFLGILIGCHDLPLVVAVYYEDQGEENIESYTLDGHYHDDSEESGLDLFMPSEKKEGWLVVDVDYLKGTYESKDDAEREIRQSENPDLIAIHITWQE